MQNNERIVLDATLKEMISERAFRAELDNGHELIAFSERAPAQQGSLQANTGDRVEVCMSPYDMEKGEILPQAENQEVLKNESA